MSPLSFFCRTMAGPGLSLLTILLCTLALPATSSAEESRQAVQQELEQLKRRIADLEQTLKQERQNEPAASEKRANEDKANTEQPSAGKVEISTAGSTMTVGGQVRLDVAYNNPATSSNYGMGTSAIPSAATAQGERGHFSMQARSSRFWFKTATPLGKEQLRTLIEIDFWGSAGTERVSNSHNIRLRHAYAEYAGLTIGQTNSTFMHSGSTPDLISDSTADVYVRQPLIRYTHSFHDGDFQIALEQPESTLLDAAGNQQIPDDDRFPDLAAKLTWKPDWGQFSLSGVLRQLRIDTGALPIGAVPAGIVDQAVGGALFASVKINLDETNNLRFGCVAGNALGRYVAYDSFSAATVDAAGNIHLQQALAGFASLQYWWDDNWHSSIAFERSQVKNDLSILPPTVYRYIQSWHANLRWAPLINTSLGIEYIHATSKRENGETGKLQRAHAQAVYKF